MNVVVNTNKRGSQVIITISDRRNEVNVRKNEFPVGDEMIEDYINYRNQQDFEKEQLLEEVRDLLVSKKLEAEESESEFE